MAKSRRGGKKQIHVLYSGFVQGVGFRVTAEEVANELKVVGWARNIPGGQVEVVAEAGEDVLKRFLEAVQAGPMQRFIKQVNVSWGEASGTFNKFEIRYIE